MLSRHHRELLVRTDCSEGPCLHAQVAHASGLGDLYDNYPGGLFCCDGGSHGTGAGQFDFSRRGFRPVGLATLQYRLKVTVSYVPLNIPVAQMDFSLTPQRGTTSWQHRFVNVHGTRLQVSAPGLEYSVPVCDDGDDMCIHVKTNTWQVNENTLDCIDCPAPSVSSDNPGYLSDPLPSGRVGIAWAAGHQHDGALGLQLWLKKPGQTDSEKTLICHSAPVIGSEVGVAGNEAGFVTGQMACRLDEPIEAPVGSTVTIRSIYDAHRPKCVLARCPADSRGLPETRPRTPSLLVCSGTGFVCRYNQDGFYTPKDGIEYAHTGVMGYGRLRWVDMDAYDAIATTRSSSASTAGASNDLTTKLAQLLIGLDLTPAQMQQLQSGLADSGLLEK